MTQDFENLELLVKELTLELRASEARFRNIIDNNPLGLLIVDKSEIVQFANPVAGKFLEQDLDELLGTTLGFCVIPGQVFEHRIARQNGEPRLLEVHGFQTEWENKSARGATLRDITRP